MNFSSNHGQILLGLKELVLSLQPEDITDMEVEVRDGWLFNGEPMKGVSIYEAGESSRSGTIGTQDIGYMCGIAFVREREGDAALSSDRIMRWRELVRRRLQDNRLSVPIANKTDPLEHVCLVQEAGKNLTNLKKYGDWVVRHLTVGVWIREKYVAGY